MDLQRFTQTMAWLAGLSMLILGAPVTADEPISQQAQPVPRTGSQHFVDQPLEPKVETDLNVILRDWEKASASRRRLDARFSRFRYDRTFEVERRGIGSLAIDVTGRAVYKLLAAKIEPGIVSRRRGANGQRYHLISEEPQRWHWTGTSLIWVATNERIFEEMAPPSVTQNGDFRPDPPPLPEGLPLPLGPPLVECRSLAEAQFLPAIAESSSSSTRLTSYGARPEPAFITLLWAIHSGTDFSRMNLSSLHDAWKEMPLAQPFLLGMPAHELKQRFEIEVVKQTSTDVSLKFKPRLKKERQLYHHVILLMARDDYRPLAIKIVDTTTAELIHVFSEVRINPLDGDEFENLDPPDLEGYRVLVNENVSPRK